MNRIQRHQATPDRNGNSRVYCHFLNLLTEAERNDTERPGRYALAIKRANRLGGRKYNTKSFRGGLIFQDVSEGRETEPHINAMLEELTAKESK